MATGGHYDASSCSTTASEQSDRRKRHTPNDEEVSFKPYECRFCPMKFAKSQALGGHMNRHRQEREREQVVQARQLLMQQEFSSALLMSGQNPSSALPKLSQAHLSRSASEGSLKDGIRMSAPPFGAASPYRGVFQSNPYNTTLGTPSLSWSLGNVLEASQNSESAFSLDGGIVPPYQNRPPYCSTLNSNNSYIMPQPLNRAHSQHDMMLSAPYDKAMRLSMYPLDPDTLASHRSNSLESQQNQAQEVSILADPANVAMNLLSSNRSLVHHKNSDMKNVHSFSQALSLQSQQNNVGAIDNGFQFVTYPGSEGARLSVDFNLSSTNQLDELPWMHGNTKTVRPLNMLSNANDDYHHDLENSEPKMDDGRLTVADSEQPKTVRWDLALSSPDNVNEESKIRDLTPVVGGESTMQFDTNYGNATSGIEGKESINK